MKRNTDRDSSRASMGDDDDDVDVELAIAKNLWKNHRLLPPTSKFKEYWDMVMLLFGTLCSPRAAPAPRAPYKIAPAAPHRAVFYNCIFIPVELCFAFQKVRAPPPPPPPPPRPRQPPPFAARSRSRTSSSTT